MVAQPIRKSQASTSAQVGRRDQRQQESRGKFSVVPLSAKQRSAKAWGQQALHRSGKKQQHSTRSFLVLFFLWSPNKWSSTALYKANPSNRSFQCAIVWGCKFYISVSIYHIIFVLIFIYFCFKKQYWFVFSSNLSYLLSFLLLFLSSPSLPPPLSLLSFLLFIETRFHVAHNGLKFAIKPKMTLNSWFFYLQLQ